MSIIKSVIYRINGNVTTEKLIKKGLIVGKDFYRGHDVLIVDSHCWLITIGNNVSLAPRVHILAHDASTKRIVGYTRIAKVTIGNNVFVGAGTIILPGVNIGDDCVIGAGSVVTHDLEGGAVYAGNPCKRIMTIQEFENKHLLQMKTSAVFEKEYTENGGITFSQKEEMKKRIKEKAAYVR